MKEIKIYGIIGELPGEVSSSQISRDIEDIGDGPAVVRINSPGGSVAEGFAIYNRLREKSDKITVIVDGAAWSIASLIAMAGHKTVMRKASSMMIHDAWGLTIGNAEDHIRNADALDKLSATIAGIYAEKTGKPAEEMRKLMLAETWFDPQEAVDMGLADEVSADPAVDNYFQEFENFAVHKFARYRAFAERLGGRAPTARNNTGPRQEERSMTETCENARPAAIEPAAAADDTKAQQQESRIGGAAPENHTQVQSRPGPVPVLGAFAVRQEGLPDLLRGRSYAEQKRFLCAEWQHLKRAYPLFAPQGANIDQSSPAGALVPALLSSTVLTVLQNRLALLSSFARNLQAGRIGRNTIQVPIVTAYGSAQVNPTNFENTAAAAATFRNVAINPQHISVLIHLENAESQNGYQISWFAEIKAAELADAIQQRVNAVLTPTNFTGQSNYARTIATWSASDLKELWARLSKAPVRNIILDPGYFKVHLPDNLQSFNPLDGWTYPGWDGFYVNTNWTGAGANVKGFACNPQAVAVAAGLPVELPDVPNRPSLLTSTLESNGLQFDQYTWFSPATRTHWVSLDVMFGAALGDPTAGVIIRDATT